jgi:hypothetical protein
MKKALIISLAVLSGWMQSCKPGDPNHDEDEVDTDTLVSEPIAPMQPVSFDADSAYGFIEKQVKFGPRVPGSAAHAKTAAWLIDKLNGYTDTVHVQKGEVVGFKGQTVPFQNIIGVFNPNSKDRILLSAHWDTRPLADEDPNASNRPADGANDGGSGVGVLLEIARQLHANRPGLGIDIVLFDVEDGGERRGNSETWCLGSQYWSKTPHVPGYKARFGILLDMVGAKDAVFPYELHSLDFASDYVYLVWQTAQSLGYGNFFRNEKGGHITDDHYYINSILGIRTLDIIQYNTNSDNGFGEYWHTQNDNMSIIDRKTLKAVGHTVIEVIYRQNNAGK